MELKEIFAFFVDYILAPLVLGLGLFGNLISLKVINGKKFRNVGPNEVYFFLYSTLYICFK